MMDAPMLGRVMASVLSNVLEAMPGSGVLTARLRRTGLGKVVERQVADSGRGIPGNTL